MTLVSGKAQRAAATFRNSVGASVLRSELGQQCLQDAWGEGRGGGGVEGKALSSEVQAPPRVLFPFSLNS